MFSFKLGADPEFAIVSKDRILNAIDLLRTSPELARNSIPTEGGELGVDGHAETAEIRPKATNDPKEMATNIGKIYQKFAEITHPEIDGFVTSKFLNVGGHIHFEMIPSLPYNRDTYHRNLQDWLATFFVPVFLSENKISVLQRVSSGSYGRFKDWREHNPTADVRTHEFRTPTPEWTLTPKLVECTMAYMGVVYHEFINHVEKHVDVVNQIGLCDENMQDAAQIFFLNKSELVADAFMRIIKKTIPTFELYPEYKEQCDYIMNYKQVIKDKEKVEYSLKKGWNLMTAKAMTEKDFKYKKKKASDPNVSPVSIHPTIGYLLPSYGQEIGVEKYAQQFALFLAEKKKPLKHSYYFFGLRKDYGTFIGLDAKNNFYGTPIDEEDVNITIREEGCEPMETKKSVIFSNLQNRMTRRLLNSRCTIAIGIPKAARLETGFDFQGLLNVIKDCEQGKTSTVTFREPTQNKEVTITDSNFLEPETGYSSTEKMGRVQKEWSNISEDVVTRFTHTT